MVKIIKIRKSETLLHIFFELFDNSVYLVYSYYTVIYCESIHIYHFFTFFQKPDFFPWTDYGKSHDPRTASPALSAFLTPEKPRFQKLLKTFTINRGTGGLFLLAYSPFFLIKFIKKIEIEKEKIAQSFGKSKLYQELMSDFFTIIKIFTVQKTPVFVQKINLLATYPQVLSKRSRLSH